MIELNVINLVWIFVVFVIVSISYVAYCRLSLPLEYRQLSSHVPSITKSSWSEIMMSLELAAKSPEEFIPFLSDLFQKYGPVVHLSLAGRSYVLLNDPDDIKILLTSTQHINKGIEYNMMKPWLNEGLLTSSGSKWQNRRKLLTGTFHFKTLHMYTDQINRHSRVLANKFLEASLFDKGIDIREYVTLCSLDIICETIMGTEMNAQQGESVNYVYSIKSSCKVLIDRILRFWLWNDLIFKMSPSGRTFYKSIKVLHDYTENVIKKKRMLLDATKNQNTNSKNGHVKIQTNSFLDLLINLSNEHPDQMTDRDIREEVDTFLFEGHDTTSIALTMTLVLLGIHRDVQDRARQELHSIFGNSDRDAATEDLNNMRYLEAVIKESLRLYPSVPAFSRELQSTLRLDKYNIPPMTTVVVAPYTLHRKEEIYPNPEEFDPERFLDKGDKSKFLFGYLPFSAGARNCIGQKYAMNQMKTVISTVLRKTKIDALGNQEDILVVPQLVTRIESIPKMKFHSI